MTIIEKENVQITDQSLERVIDLNKDFRQILNTLQCLHSIKLNEKENYDPIQPDEINAYLGIPTQSQITDIIYVLLNKPLIESCEYLIQLFKDNSWNLPDLIHRLCTFVIGDKDMSDKRKFYLIGQFSDIEAKLSHSNDAEVQLYALVAAFKQSATY